MKIKELIMYLKVKNHFENYAANITSYRPRGRLYRKCTKEEFMEDPEKWLTVVFGDGKPEMIKKSFQFDKTPERDRWYRITDAQPNTMRELTKSEKLQVINELKNGCYKSEYVHFIVLQTIEALFDHHRIKGCYCVPVFLREKFPEAEQVIINEGNNRAGHEDWEEYPQIISDPVELIFFREHVLREIIDLKNTL